MAVSLVKLAEWKLAEEEVELTRHLWQAAVDTSHRDPIAERDLKAALESKRESARALFLEAMKEATEVAQSLHHPNVPLKRP